MAYHNRIVPITLVADADLSAHQFKIVEQTTTGCRLSAGDAIGILQNIPESGEAASVAIDGESKVIAGGTLAIGDWIIPSSGGWAVAVVSGDVLPEVVVGRSMLVAASGDIGTVHIQRQAITNVVSGSIAAALP